MKQKYFIIFFLTLFFISTYAQNNALLISNENYFRSNSRFITWNGDYYLDNSTFTIEYNFYLNALTNYNGRFCSFDSNNSIAKPIHFYVDNTGISHLLLGNGTTEEAVTGMPIFNVQEWYHVTFVVTNTATKNVKVYVNGAPTVDYNFTTTLDGFSGAIALNLGAANFNSSTNVGDAKFDNLRIWSSARTATEIANNYASCLTGNETGLVSLFDFDKYNGRYVSNLANTAVANKNYIIYNSYSYVIGSGCSVTSLYDPITVTGSYNGILYYIGQVNGKPYYKTDNIELNCSNNLSQAQCAGSPYYYDMAWNNNQWEFKGHNCVWELGESCVSTDDTGNPVATTNTADTTVPPCTGWSSSSFNFCPSLLVENSKLVENIAIFPNPAHDLLTIETKENIRAQLIDALGNTILDIKEVVALQKIDLSIYAQGIYFLKVTNQKGENKTYKIIKE